MQNSTKLIAVVTLIVGIISMPWWAGWIQMLREYAGYGEISYSQTATSTVNLANVFEAMQRKETSLDKQEFIRSYVDAPIVGHGYFSDISKTDNTYYVDIRIGNNLVTCTFFSTPESDRELLLLREGDPVDFAGTFTNAGVWGRGWEVRDCHLL